MIVRSINHCFSFFFSLVYFFCFSQANFSFAPLVLDMLNFLMDAIQTNFQQASAVGSSSRAQQALSELHTVEKAVEMTDQLMVSVSWGHDVWWLWEPTNLLRFQSVLDALRSILRAVDPWPSKT